MTRARRVAVRELIQQRDLRPASQYRVKARLLKHRASELHLGVGDDLKARQKCGGARAAMRVHMGHNNVGAAFRAPVSLAEHGAGRADARRGAQVDPQLPASSRFRLWTTWRLFPGHDGLADSSALTGISALPQTTLGYERRFNWAFRAPTEEAFVKSVLAGQPDPPTYFARMKQVNRDGPRVLGRFPEPPAVGVETLTGALAHGAWVVDSRSSDRFALGFLPGSLNIPLNNSFGTWAGWLVDGATSGVLIVEATRVAEAVRSLALVGIDQIQGWVDAAALESWTPAERPLSTIPRIDADDLAASLTHGGATLVDVRNDGEWTGVGHIAGAQHIPLGHLAARQQEISRARPVIVQCQGGSRSAIAASVLRGHGFASVVNFAPGIGGWLKDGRPVVHD